MALLAALASKVRRDEDDDSRDDQDNEARSRAKTPGSESVGSCAHSDVQDETEDEPDQSVDEDDQERVETRPPRTTSTYGQQTDASLTSSVPTHEVAMAAEQAQTSPQSLEPGVLHRYQTLVRDFWSSFQRHPERYLNLPEEAHVTDADIEVTPEQATLSIEVTVTPEQVRDSTRRRSTPTCTPSRRTVSINTRAERPVEHNHE